MRQRKRQRFVLLIGAGGLLVAATVLVLSALDQNIEFFAGPSQIVAGGVDEGTRLRLGGLVVEGSVEHLENGEVRFALTDEAASVPVQFVGVLPDLFREGQGIVVLGSMVSGGMFAADEVLAKHDEAYMPPEVAEALKNADHWRNGSEAGAKPAGATYEQEG